MLNVIVSARACLESLRTEWSEALLVDDQYRGFRAEAVRDSELTMLHSQKKVAKVSLVSYDV